MFECSALYSCTGCFCCLSYSWSVGRRGQKIDRAEQAEQALQQIIAKWRQRWTVQQLQDLFGYARHVVSLQNELVKQNDYLEQQR